MKPFIAALIAGIVVFPWAYFGARWGWTGSAAITAVWCAMAYTLTHVLINPEPGVRK